MKPWPPSMKELLARRPDSPDSAYHHRLRAELKKSTSYFSAMPRDKQAQIVSTVHRLDTFATTAMSRLHFPLDQLSFVAPPDAIGANERKSREWLADRRDYEAIEAAYRARIAIFGGQWIEAVDAALDAGHYSRARFADLGSQVRSKLPRKGSKKERTELSPDHVWLVAKARTILERNPDMKDLPLARLVKNTLKSGDPIIGSVSTIRKWLARYRTLIRQGLPEQR
jgi:hypothetical protein